VGRPPSRAQALIVTSSTRGLHHLALAPVHCRTRWQLPRALGVGEEGVACSRGRCIAHRWVLDVVQSSFQHGGVATWGQL
jgi:hypothetical protein